MGNNYIHITLKTYSFACQIAFELMLNIYAQEVCYMACIVIVVHTQESVNHLLHEAFDGRPAWGQLH